MDNNLSGRIKLSGTVREAMTRKVRQALDSNPLAVERAITFLYERQTRDERAAEETRHNNQVGVKQGHGHRIAYYGRWVGSGRRLTGIHLERARRLAHTYARTQLAEAAALKARLVDND